ncbi:MAG TPA: carboxypeptidase-like regulatory domain-containing protein, partial [Niabella sp.]|nr:carboxypeptidase-like regulatory domain-containing protein [Niabella sp.]
MKYLHFFRKALLLLLCFGSLAAIAQERTVTGLVLDETSGQPLAGANMVIKGTNQNVPVSSEGEFTFKVANASTVLTVSYAGYVTREVNV